MNEVRELWVRLEMVHAVTYFADESKAAAREAGLRGFWMGYFGFRAAPMGAVGADVVENAVYNFARPMVRKSIPAAWDFAAPAHLVDVRVAAASAALRRVANPELEVIPGSVFDQLRDVVGYARCDDGSLSASNRALPLPSDPVDALWQLCTTLREHRGDAHVAALRSAGLNGCQAHLLLAADQQVPEGLLRDNRGWTADQWEADRTALLDRGLLNVQGRITPEGKRVRTDVEASTDTAARQPFDDAGGATVINDVTRSIEPAARAIERSNTIPFPNPMGLPPVT